ncbi:para-nitrobenzyl esterase [Rhizomicrobium palustre]|uniref:Carboxylic ester hydrolase n=1 Tax=Rhizomicrobium palustre TaxID=189966 RepID=A0A846MYZ2_9PROT|nr:carboxylesterase family protein [Rhizomicrobium palustre]NIK88232.1 para-nitrobenzyl esterase [Rhizomicrobium palustre]
MFRKLCGLALFAALAVSAAAQSAPEVTIDSGKLKGVEENGIVRFLGIPYAAPPVGELRWKAPQPVKPWLGVRDASQFGPACSQTATWVKDSRSEDCLFVNITTPNAKSKKPYPVLVWIHGGGLTSGTGSEWGPLGGKALTEKGMILVRINYRLGVFGFFAHPELSAESPDHASGNQGFRDQIAALQWVKRNIAAFGGDPNNVTIAGCSAGGSSVAALTVSPLANGLFQRGISESGVSGPLPPLAEAEKFNTDAAAKTVGTSRLADLRKLSTEELLKKDWVTFPVTDGVVLTESPRDSFAKGHQNKVPVLLGWNADEGVDLAGDFFGAKTITTATYEAGLHKLFGPQIPPPILAQYPGKSDDEAQASAQRLVTDMIGLQHFGWATMRANAKADPTYLYHYVHSPVEPPKESPCGYGCKAGHGAEIRFAYGLLWPGERDWSADDLALQAEMLGYWTNFAKTGNPNGERQSDWKPFDGTPETVKRLGSEAEIKERGNFTDFRPYLSMLPQ